MHLLQSVKQLTLNPCVDGSNPFGHTFKSPSKAFTNFVAGATVHMCHTSQVFAM
ncbi:hypothetical protein MCEMZLE14_01320 [Candidatus Nanopelagicaceae bacterium]